MWTAVGVGAGFGVGLWAGLTAFDDAVNSDRKVWTSAVVGAAVGGVTGYLIGRARHDRTRPSTTRMGSTDRPIDATLVRELARSVRFGHTALVDGPSPDRMRGRP
jgi:membrane protein YqaA with SNARE-associated domain